jgi:hypothetical protein
VRRNGSHVEAGFLESLLLGMISKTNSLLNEHLEMKGFPSLTRNTFSDNLREFFSTSFVESKLAVPRAARGLGDEWIFILRLGGWGVS